MKRVFTRASEAIEQNAIRRSDMCMQQSLVELLSSSVSHEESQYVNLSERASSYRPTMNRRTSAPEVLQNFISGVTLGSLGRASRRLQVSAQDSWRFSVRDLLSLNFCACIRLLCSSLPS
jgi:hypothetical protein